MAIVLKIQNEDGTDSYDLISGSSKIQYITGSIIDQIDHTVEDKQLTFRTVAKGTAAEIRTAFNTIEILLHKITLWQENKSLDESIWLNAQSDGTEKERRTLLKTWSRQDESEGVSDPLFDKSIMVISTWTFTRHHAWEGLYANRIEHLGLGTSCNTGAAMDAFVTDQTNDHDGFEVIETANFLDDGTKPGRIMTMAIVVPDSAAGDEWDKLWIGLKAVRSVASSGGDKWGAHTDMTDQENSTIMIGAVNNNVVDATALHGRSCSMGLQTTGGWNPRVYNDLPHAHEDSSVGSYLVLARMKTGSGTIARAAMFHSWNNYQVVGGVQDHYDDVYVEDTEWHMYEMGVIQVPPEGFRAARQLHYTDLYAMNLGLSAELISGSGDLFIDYMAWIPQEHYLYASNIWGTDVAGHDWARIYTTEDDEILGITHKIGFPWAAYRHEITSKNWTWPADPDKKLIVVACTDTYPSGGEHEFDISLEITAEIIPRYYSYNAD